MLVGSITGYQGSARHSIYGGVKAFTRIFAEGLWLELRDQAVRRGDDMRAFHTRALLLGSVGLDTLRRALTDEMMLPLDTEDDDDEDDDE